MRLVVLALLTSTIATPAIAEDRDLCPNRPGLGTPSCTVEPGRVVIETGLTDLTRDDSSEERTDTILIGDTLARIGATDNAELQLGWTPFGHRRTRDKTAGDVDRAGRVGDALIGTKINLSHPDGSGFSAAAQAQATLPVGRSPIGAGDLGVSITLPLSYELPRGLLLEATPEWDAAVDEDGHGRHTAWGGTIGLGIDLADNLTATVETQVIRDRDPGGHETMALEGVSLAWQRGKSLQLDAGVNVGLNGQSDDIELYAGISRRF